jgi:CRISPR system Cascade subunit CasD
VTKVRTFFTMRMTTPIAAIRGSVVGDGRIPSQPIPSPSMVVGMIGAALGIDRREHAALQRLQNGVEVAWLVHREPSIVVDYQTTDLSRPHMSGPMWAHDGQKVWTERRTGGNATRTLVSERDMTCDVDMTAVVDWFVGDPTAEAVLAALDTPAMPLSIGARWALPTQPIGGEVVKATTLEEAVAQVRVNLPGTVRSYIPVGHISPPGTFVVTITASRDWASRRHAGSSLYKLGT